MYSLDKTCPLDEIIPATNNESKEVTIHSPFPQIQITHNIKLKPVTFKAALPVLRIFQYYMQLQGGGISHLVVFSPVIQEQHMHQEVFLFHTQRFQPHLQYPQPSVDLYFSGDQTSSA